MLLQYIQSPHLLSRIPGAIFLSETDWRSRRKRIALTLDDGPDLYTTPQILKVLEEQAVRATFFLIGERALQYPQIVRQIYEQEHQIGNHSFFEEFSVLHRGYAEKLLQTEMAFREILGEEFFGSRWVRPGGGLYTPQMMRIVRSNPQYWGIVLGSIFPFDTHICSVEFASRYILDRAYGGAILILHDGKGKGEIYDDQARGARAAQTIARIVPPLRQRGYQFVTLDQLLL